MKIIKTYMTALLLACGIGNLSAQEASFIDGYHGGIYGHYPLWNTQFYVDSLAAHPEWRINLEIEPETWDTVQVRTPEAYRAFQKIAVGPRIEFVNPAYGQPYAFNIQGESLIRHFEYGIKKMHKHFPDVQFTTYSSEEPCFTSCLPTILKSFGFKYAVLKCPNTCWGGYVTPYGKELVNWIGPDGTTMLAVPRYACEELQENSTWQTTGYDNSDRYLEACREAGIRHPAGMCFQDAGWKNGPWLGTGDKIRSNSAYRTWTEYIEKVSDGKSNDDWRVPQEAMLANLMWGSQVMQRLAQAVRTAENKIVMAEKADAIHFLTTGKTADPARINEAWRTLLLAQHHDSWIVPYNRLTPLHTWADEILAVWTPTTDRIASDIIRESLSKTGNAAPIIRVTNTTASARREAVNAELPVEYAQKPFRLTGTDGKELPIYVTEKAGKTICHFMADVPAFGYSEYRIQPGMGKETTPEFACTGRQEAADRYVLESDIYKIVLDLSKGGCIESLFHKGKGKEFVDSRSDYRFNELRGHFYDEKKFRSTTEKAASVAVVEHTPYSITVEIRNEIAGHPCFQRLTLHQGEERIDGHIRIDWKGNPGIGEYRDEAFWKDNRRAFKNDRYKLLLLLPAAFEGQQSYKNAPFDVCKSMLDDTFFDTWDSHKHNIIVNWVDVTDQDGKYGLSLFSDHTTSYAHGKEFPLALNIQYSGKGLWGADYPINGPTSVHYALLPHTGTWDRASVWSRSSRWNEPLLVYTNTAASKAENHSFIRLDKPGYEITSVKVRGNELFVRLFNAEADGDPLTLDFGFPVSRVEETSLDGKQVTGLNVQRGKKCNRVQLAMPRFAIRTLKVHLKEL